MIRLTFFLFLLVCCLSIPLLAVDDRGISIEQIYEKSLSPDGKFAAARVIKGEKQSGTYLINTSTMSLIGTIDPLAPGSSGDANISAIWNKKASKVAMLGHYGRIGVYLELFTLGSDGQFKRIPFNYPKEIEINNKESQKDPGIFFRQDICGLGTWIDESTVALVAGRYYGKNDGDISYLTTFNVHITKDGKAEVQNVKVIGSLSMEEYETFKATHNYQF